MFQRFGLGYHNILSWQFDKLREEVVDAQGDGPGEKKELKPKKTRAPRYDYKKHDEDIRKLVKDSKEKDKMDNMQVRDAVNARLVSLGLNKDQRQTGLKRWKGVIDE